MIIKTHSPITAGDFMPLDATLWRYCLIKPYVLLGMLLDLYGAYDPPGTIIGVSLHYLSDALGPEVNGANIGFYRYYGIRYPRVAKRRGLPYTWHELNQVVNYARKAKRFKFVSSKPPGYLKNDPKGA